MKGPLQLIRRRSPEDPAPQADDPQPTTEAPTEAASTGSGPADSTAAGTQAGSIPPPPGEGAPAEGEPAGREPAADKPSFRHRGRMRRRLRYLRRVRELGFRDLGGLVFDQHRFARPNPELVGAKLGALAAVDAELRALEHALADRRPITELREPGVSVCPRCGALHGSDAHFCPSCGAPFQGPRAIAGIGEGVSTTVGEIGTVEPTAPAQIGPPATEPFAPEPLWAQQRPEAGDPGAGDARPAAPTSAEQPTEERATADRAGGASDQPTEVTRPDAGDSSANGDPAGRSEPAGERSET